MHYLVPGPLPCPEVVAVSYIRQAKVLTLFSVKGDTQVKQKNHTNGFLTTEAEYVALSEAGREACWLRSLYEELGQKQKSSTLIKGNNDGSIAMARNLQFHKQSKHIDIQWHWVCDLNEQKVIKIESCHDPEHTVDVLSKGLAKLKHQKHVSEMGLAPA